LSVFPFRGGPANTPNGAGDRIKRNLTRRASSRNDFVSQFKIGKVEEKNLRAGKRGQTAHRRERAVIWKDFNMRLPSREAERRERLRGWEKDHRGHPSSGGNRSRGGTVLQRGKKKVAKRSSRLDEKKTSPHLTFKKDFLGMERPLFEQ